MALAPLSPASAVLIAVAAGLGVWLGRRSFKAAELSPDFAPGEMSNLQLGLAFDAGDLSAWHWSPESGSIRLMGDLHRRLQLGVNPSEAEYFDRVHPDDRKTYREACARFLSGADEVYECIYRMRQPQGDWSWIQSRGKAIRTDADGHPLEAAGIHANVTDSKQHALELERLQREAHAANKAKSAFLANMSHEIRTPLTAILGYTDLMLDAERGELSDDTHYQLETIQAAGRHLLLVVGEILDYSKIEADSMQLEEVETDLPQLLREVEALMRPKAHDKGLALEQELVTEIPGSIITDPTRVRQILINLLGNAIKFTQRGSVVLRTQVLEDGQLLFEVEDSGPGMSMDRARTVFEPFAQGDTSITRRFGGTGLGLPISRRLARMMGGDLIIAHTVESKGSCFALELPTRIANDSNWVYDLTREPNARIARRGERLDGLSGGVLLVEDGQVNRRLITTMLERMGLEVTQACNGREALDRIVAGGDFRLILTDLQMPEMTGFELVDALGERAYEQPVIALSAFAMSEDRQRCIQAGFDDYLTKPLGQDDLYAACKRWLTERSQRLAA